MSWFPLDPDEVRARLSNKEYQAYLAAAKNSPDFDMVEKIIGQTVAMVRAKVLTCRVNATTMGAPGTIPEECLHAAVTIARASLVASFPVAEGETDLRKAELDQAHTFLDAVASCEIVIAADGSGTVPGSDPVAHGSAPSMDFAQ
ncbi:MAG: hypothetical protein QM755_02810 [Luteolibacter sp.]